MFVNRMPRYEPLSDEALAIIDAGAERLAAEVGVQFDHPRAIELFRAAGQTVDGSTVRFDPGFLRAQAGLAPAEFRMRARNPERDIVVGGDHMIFSPAQGPPFVRIDGERRDGTMADLESLLKLTQLTPALDTPGRNILEPNDVPLDVRHLLRALAAIRLTDRVWSGEPSSDFAADDCIRMAEIVFGGREAIEETPVIFANCNVNSPLRFDSRMLEGILGYAAAGQAVIVTPFLLMGAMAPVSVPAALVQQNVEALAGIALVQLVRPGTPSVLGSFLSATDMKSGSPAFGGPESALGLYASGQIARRIGLPWRSGGGTLTSSPAMDYQAGYEAMNTLQAAFLAGAYV
jgi:trimethylamine--corrinoid protein Co-methyltransferase